jgi:selenocysteine-specific elongation factor
VRLHLGTAEVGARVVAGAGPLMPGERRAVRVVLDAPLVARAGDRFVLRGGARLTTIGGGVVTDPTPPGRRARPWPAADLPLAGRLGRMLDEVGAAGVAVSTLPVRLGVPRLAVDALTSAAPEVARVGDRLLAASSATEVASRAVALLDAHHAAAPLEVGLSRQALRASLASVLRAPADVSDWALARLLREGMVELDGAVVRRAGWRPQPTAAQSRTIEALVAMLDDAGLEGPSVAELTAAFGTETPALLVAAVRAGRLVQMDAERICTVGARDRGVARLQAQLTPGEVYPPGTLREVLGISRKYLMSLLEHLDREGLTDKMPEGRRWRGRPGPSCVA